MEKRLITYLFIIFSCNLIFAEVHKGSFFIDGLKFETENSDKVFLVEESYTITEDDLFHCIYEIHNEGKKNNISFSLNIHTEIQEPGVNYCETLLPEDFSIKVNDAVVDFFYKSGEKLLDSKNVFTKDYYHDCSGDIFFSFEINSNETKIIEINYSTIGYANNSKLYRINFAKNIKYNSNYKRNVVIVNSGTNSFIGKISTWNTNAYGEYENEILNLYNNHFDSLDIKFEQRDNGIILNYINSESTNIGIYSYTFLEKSPYSAYMLYPDSVVFGMIKPEIYSKIQIPKIKLFFLNRIQLSILRNAFYALHGYNFKNNELKEFFFNNLDGYSELVKKGFDEKSFNEIEKKNIELIRELENKKEPILLSDYLK